MKTLGYLFVMAILLIAGCSKDYTEDVNMDSVELKKAEVPIPMKIECTGVLDYTSELLLRPRHTDLENPESWFPKRTIISGNGTHFGKLDPDKSYYDIEVFLLGYISGTGKLTAANGDYFLGEFWVQFIDMDYNYIGEWKLMNGTGKFEGFSGTCTMEGHFDAITKINRWTLDGFIIHD